MQASIWLAGLLFLSGTARGVNPTSVAEFSVTLINTTREALGIRMKAAGPVT